MKQQQHKRCSPWRLVWIIQMLLVILVALVMIKNLGNGFIVTGDGARRSDAEALEHLGSKMQLVDKLVDSIRSLQPKVDKAMQDIQQRLPEPRSGPDWLKQRNVLLDVAAALDQATWMLQQLKNTSIGASGLEYGSSFSYGGKNPKSGSDGDGFLVEEINRYLLPRPHRLGSGRKNFMGSESTQPSIGAACVVKKELRQDLEKYMGYDIGDYCPDDWPLGQKLMVQGCEPLPRRRCLARTPQLFSATGMRNASHWSLPDDRNVRWSNYKCKSFGCLAGKGGGGGANKGLLKCSECFDLPGFESKRWMVKSSSSPVAGFTAADFSVDEVLGLKPAGEIRVGLDFSVGTGSFAARMRERNVTVVSATLNLGGPFNEAIALRGLVPLYVSVNQRLPFFDNTLDMVHTTLFLDGWIDHVLLDFIIFDWDRVLRPGGLLWIDKFFCTRDDLEEYLYFFLQLHYKKHLWVVAPKLDRDAKEVYFSAVLEKPLRPF